MTDPDHSDELVSAYLDGEANPDEVARVESDPVLLARVEVLRAASVAIGSPVLPPPASRRDAAVAAALAAGPEVVTGPEVTGITDLAAVRQSRQRRMRILSAAAVVLALAIAVPVIASLGDDDKNVDVAAATKDSADQAARGGAADTNLALEASTLDLGTFAGEDELAAAVRQQFSPEVPGAPFASGAPTASGQTGSNSGAGATGAESDTASGTTLGPRCLDALPADLAGETPFFVATATFDGHPVTVVVFAGPDGTVDGGRALALDASDCSVDADVDL